jgi:hypothetical protein
MINREELNYPSSLRLLFSYEIGAERRSMSV